jgi:hypothetical protein
MLAPEDRVEQAPRVLLRGVREDLVDASLLHDLAALHDADEVGHHAHDGEVVRDEQVGETELGLQLGEELQDLILHEHVERRDRLVEDDDVGLECERPRDRDALALATGQLVRVARGEALRSDTWSSSSRTRSRREAASPTLWISSGSAIVFRCCAADRVTRTGPGTRAACAGAARRSPCARARVSTPSISIEPEVGSSSFSTIFATVDLPEPDSPTRASVLPRGMSNDTASTARNGSLRKLP